MLQLQFRYRFMFSLAKIQSQTDIKVSAARPDLHIEIITGAKGKMVGRREGGEVF